MVRPSPRLPGIAILATLGVTLILVVTGALPLMAAPASAYPPRAGPMFRVAADAAGANATTLPIAGDHGSPGAFGAIREAAIAPMTPRPMELGTGQTITDRIAVGAAPYPGVFDNLTGEMYVSNPQTSNVSVIQTANNTVVATIPVGYLPQTGCLDPTTGDLYVSNFESGNISVISTATNRVITSINTTAGYEPTTCTYDPTTSEIYVPNPNYGSDYPQLTVIYGSNHTVKRNIALSFGYGMDPITPTIDPANGLLYVAMSSAYYSTNWVVVVNASTDSVPYVLGVGYYPTQPTYDPVNGWLYVANNGGDTVSVLNGTNNTVFAQTNVGDFPNVPAVNVTTGAIYVPQWFSGPSGNISVLNATTNNVTKVVPVGANPQTPLVDPLDGDLYVAESNDGNLTQISMSTLAIVRNYSIGTGVREPAMDGVGDLYVPYQISAYIVGGVAVIASGILHASLTFSPSRVAVDNPLEISTDSVGGSGLLTFAYTNLPPGCTSADTPSLNCTPTRPGTYAVTVMVSDPHGDEANETLNLTVYVAYPLSITEVGLPAGATWFFNASGLASLHYTATNATVYFPNGTFAYHLATGNKDFAPVPSAPLFDINGGPATLWANFSLVTYPVTFTSSGLPNGTSWYVNISGEPSQIATTDHAAIALDNGTHAFSVVAADRRYSPAPGIGTIAVSGRSRTVNVTFHYLEFTFGVAESGLPAEGLWFLNFTGGRSIESSVVEALVSLANGSYAYSLASVDKDYAATPGSGTLVVLGPHTLVNVTFAPVTYSVPFTESGLPQGTAWTVHLGSSLLSGGTPTLNASVMNGTYPYTVGAIPGWEASRYSGSVTVQGAASGAVAITWTQVVYTVTFSESGLASGASWSVTVLGSSHSTSQPSLVLDLANGSYSYAFGALGGYGLSNGSGELVVKGSPTSAIAQYSATSSSGFAVPIPLFLALVAVAAVGGVGTFLWLRRRPRAPAPTTEEPTDASAPDIPESGAPPDG